jgi:hypothetical protein
MFVLYTLLIVGGIVVFVAVVFGVRVEVDVALSRQQATAMGRRVR